MKRELVLLSLVFFIPLIFADNESMNESNNLTSGNSTWYGNYLENIGNIDVTTIVAVIIGLLLVNFFGKIAFKLIKWVVIILLIILLVRLVF